MLGESSRWDAVLSEGEQESLAFARLLLHAPTWLIMDEALEALEDEASPRVREMLTQDLQHTAVLNMGRSNAQDVLFGRVIHLVNDPDRERLPARSPPQLAAASST
jgi:vitamin B12/bleomycin/antimicrobial peptide transport system ATP-binding/permease protein